jgi:uncharacterized protein (TIRG00374 family)
MKKIFSFIQLAVGAGLLAFLFWKMQDKGDLLDAFRDAGRHWLLLGVGVLLFLPCLMICTARWRILLAAQGLRLGFLHALELFFVGHFFNSFLFGVTGGDLVKAYYAARATKHKRTEAVSTVFIDRVIGLLALIALIVVVMLMRMSFFLRYGETRLALVFNVCLLAGAVAGLVVVFRQDVFDRWPLFRRFKEQTRAGDIISRSYSAFQACFSHRGVLAKTMLLSVLNHIILTVSVVFLGRALEIDISVVEYFSTIPIINAVSAIPLTPGGLGTREAAAVFLLGALGVPGTRAALLSLLIYGTILSWSFVGGIVYLFYSCRAGRVPMSLADENGAPTGRPA